MKRITSLLLVIAFAGVMLLPVSLAVNHHSGNQVLRADGVSPIPPIPPCVFNAPEPALTA